MAKNFHKTTIEVVIFTDDFLDANDIDELSGEVAAANGISKIRNIRREELTPHETAAALTAVGLHPADLDLEDLDDEAEEESEQ